MLKCLECITSILPIQKLVLCQIMLNQQYFQELLFCGININIQVMYSIWLLIHTQAIESTTKNVKYVVKVVDVPDEEESTPHAPTVKLNNNFMFESDGIRVFRHFLIDKGIVLEILAK